MGSSHAPQGGPSRYLSYLDGLRGVAILLVMAHHTQGYFGQIGRTFHGWCGVDIFFVISGFLITALFVQEQERFGSFSFRRFYARRFLRLMPVYYTFLLVALIYNGWAALPGIGICAAYLTNYDLALGWDIARKSGVAITWSLAVEEQFYLLWPITLYLAGRHAFRVALVVIVATPLWRAWLCLNGASIHYLYNAFDSRLDGLMIGCAIALLWADPDWRQRIRAGLAGTWAPLLLVLLCFWAIQALVGLGETNLYFWSVLLPLFTLMVGVLLLTLLVHPQSGLARVLSYPVLTRVGRLSYSLYLWHALAYDFTEKTLAPYLAAHFPGGALWQRLSTIDTLRLVLSFALAIPSYYLVERPFLRLKKWLESKPAPRAESASVAPVGPAAGLTLVAAQATA
jgi:peptidoglycan/LPS O-acetylase OafA/YrhL